MVAITVSDPRIEDPDTRHSFTSYLVTTKQGNSVRRRYSDFRWLYQRLHTEVPGAIIPIIPHTRTLMSNKKFNIEFIEERRRDLQEFLHGVAIHSELCRAPSMTPFMLYPLGEDFDNAKKKMEQTTPTNVDVFKMAEDGSALEAGKAATVARQGISSFFAKMRLSAGSQELLTAQVESQVIALHAYITEVSVQVKALAKASDSLLKSTLSSADAHHEIGVPIGFWRTSYMQQNEAQDEDVKSMMAGICKFSDEIASLLRKKYKEEEFLFGHNIQKLANYVSAFELAMSQRKKRQISYTHSHNSMIEKNAALEKAQKNLKPPEVTDKLNNERVELEKKIEEEKNRFDEVTNRLLRDAETHKPKLLQMLQDSFLMFAKAQISYTTRITEAFQRMVPLLEDSGSDGGDKTEDSSPPPPPSAPPPPPPEESDKN